MNTEILSSSRSSIGMAYELAKQIEIEFIRRKSLDYRRRCNICEQVFNSNSTYTRFCEKCRKESDLLSGPEWHQIKSIPKNCA